MNRKRSYTKPYTTPRKKVRGTVAARAGLILAKRRYNNRVPSLGYTRITGNFGRFQPSSISGEKKFIDIIQSPVLSTTTGLILPTAAATSTPAVAMPGGSFNQIAQGDQEYQRIGKEVVVTSILVRGQFVLNAGAVFSDISRFLIVQDTQCNGAAATVNNVLNFTGQPVSINSFNNIENSRRFIVISDTRYDVTTPTSNASISSNPKYVDFEIYKKCNIPIVFDTTATSGTLATVRSNNIFGITVSAGGVESFVNFNMRLRYQDK